MGLSDFTNNGNNNNGSSGSSGSSITMTGSPAKGNGQNSRNGSDVPDILVDLSAESHFPCLHREAVLTQLSSILIGMQKPNALLIGPAGTGKTAIAEELAVRIKANDPRIPPQLRDKTIYSLECSDLVSGNSFVGQLEETVKGIIAFLSDPKNNAIVFIDEIHQLMSESGTYKIIAQILKPALSRGKIKVIGATTVQEAKKLDTDPAFNRRFTRVLVDELTKEQTQGILLSIYPSLVKHYGQNFIMTPELAGLIVNTADEFCTAGSHRPDNAITLFDRSVASAVMDKQGMMNSTDPAIASAAMAMPGVILSETSVRKTAIKLVSGNNEPADFDEQKFRKDFSYIRGQDGILEPLLRVMKRHTAHIRPQRKPLTLLFMGASGTGKTEITKVLAKNYLNEKPIILNMTEYASSADINRIIGAPAGYVGYNDDSELPFDALDTNPYQVVLLDEFEKCHPSVQRLFMRVFDEGTLQTNKGKTIDFSKSIIIATTNAGCTNDAHAPIGFCTDASEAEPTDKEITDVLSKWFSLELLNRFTKRYRFRSISREVFVEVLKDIYETQVREILDIRPSVKIPPVLSDADADILADRYYDKQFGARPAYEAVSEHIDETMVP